MPLTGVATLTCDGCSEVVSPDLGPEESPNDAVDSEGWGWGDDLVKLLCPECFEEAERED